MNGGGGSQFNDDISLDTLDKMKKVCFKHGTTGFLPTMISSSFSDIKKSLDVVKAWVDTHGLTNGVLGIHLEGPFLSIEKKGIHEESLIQVPSKEKLELIASYADHFPILMTIAPENVSGKDVAFLACHGVIIAIGHSNASYEIATKCFDLGATAVTHLFNAMSGLTGRDPGVIGAVLNHPSCYTAIIPDLHHVHPANISISTKIKPEHMFIVTDCHSPAGT